MFTEAVHDTSALRSPRVAEGEVGASGAFAGVNADDADDANESPMEFVALTVNVYAVPFVSPVTTQVSGLGVTPTIVEQVRPPGFDVTVYALTGEPLDELACHDRVTCVSPRVPMTVVGAVGTPAGVTALEAPDAVEVPAALVAVTVNV